MRTFYSFSLFLVLITISPLSLAAQQEADSLHWNAYYGVNTKYFFEKKETDSTSLLFEALKHQIAGEADAFLLTAEQLLGSLPSEDPQRIGLAGLLYDTYLEVHNYSAALQLDRAEQLGRGGTDALEFIRRQSRSRVIGEGVTSVAFDGFYITAKIGADSIRIFLDTGAPGIIIDARWVDQNNWSVDTTHRGWIVEPYIGIEYPSFPTMIGELSIGDFTFKHLPANAVRLTEEQWTKKTSSGIRRYDIIMGLDAFYGLIDGVEFDYAAGMFRLFKELPTTTAPPNFQRVEGKPAISFSLGGKTYPAFLDTGSPRHVFTEEMITDPLDSFTNRYGSYEYQVHTLIVGQLLDQQNFQLEAANYARQSSGDKYRISAHFGSFPAHRLRYDLRARRVELFKD